MNLDYCVQLCNQHHNQNQNLKHFLNSKISVLPLCRQSPTLAPNPAKSLQSCLTLSDPIDCSPPGSTVHGILQARVLECGAIALPLTLGSH